MIYDFTLNGVYYMYNLQTFKSALESALADARQAFSEAACGKTVCQIGREQTQNLPLTTLEGRMQALTDACRCLKQKNRQDMQTCLQKQFVRWQKLTELSEDWRVYKQAGIDALQSVQNMLNSEFT